MTFITRAADTEFVFDTDSLDEAIYWSVAVGGTFPEQLS